LTNEADTVVTAEGVRRSDTFTALVIDDEPSNTRLLNLMLRQSFSCEVLTTTDSRTAVALFLEHRPDLVLMDLHMPYVSGLELLAAFQDHIPPTEFVPIIVLTGDTTTEAREKALRAGAHDFLTKPFEVAEVLLRIRNTLRTRRLNREVVEQNRTLEARVAERTEQLDAARIEALIQLARAAEFRDDDTGQHTRRVGDMAGRIAATMGLEPAVVELIRLAAPLHDIGKIGIPDAILLKPDRLTPAEWTVMRQHTTIGASILADSRSPVLRMAQEIALAHHERWDGAGYPEGLENNNIPLASRIVAVADTFDALTHARPYKPAFTIEESLGEITANAGGHFDPDVVNAFLGIER